MNRRPDSMLARHHRVAATGARLRSAAITYAESRSKPAGSFGHAESDEHLLDAAFAYVRAIENLGRQR